MWTFETLALRLGGCALFVVAGALLAYRAWAMPALPRVVLGEKGRQRSRWLAQDALNIQLDAMLRRVGAWVRIRLPAATLASIEQALLRAGHPAGWSASELVAASLISEAIGLVLALLWWWWLGPSLSVVLLAVAPAAWPWLRVRQVRGARVLALERSLPVAMDLVTLCVRAGGDFPGALLFVVGEMSSAHRICRDELMQVLEALALGRTRQQALEAFGERIDSLAVREFVSALVQSERRGIPLCESLTVQSRTLRRLRSERAEEQAARAGVRMVLPTMMILACIMTLLLGPMVIQGVKL